HSNGNGSPRIPPGCRCQIPQRFGHVLAWTASAGSDTNPGASGSVTNCEPAIDREEVSHRGERRAQQPAAFLVMGSTRIPHRFLHGWGFGHSVDRVRRHCDSPHGTHYSKTARDGDSGGAWGESSATCTAACGRESHARGVGRHWSDDVRAPFRTGIRESPFSAADTGQLPADDGLACPSFHDSHIPGDHFVFWPTPRTSVRVEGCGGFDKSGSDARHPLFAHSLEPDHDAGDGMHGAVDYSSSARAQHALEPFRLSWFYGGPRASRKHQFHGKWLRSRD